MERGGKIRRILPGPANVEVQKYLPAQLCKFEDVPDWALSAMTGERKEDVTGGHQVELYFGANAQRKTDYFSDPFQLTLSICINAFVVSRR